MFGMTRETESGRPADHPVPTATPTTISPDVDGALLAEAGRVLGSSPADAINQALAELIQGRLRQQAVEAELADYRSGRFAGLRPERGPA